MDNKTKKLMTIHKFLYLWDDTDRFCESRKERRGLASIDDCADAKIQRLKVYAIINKETLITAANNSNINRIKF